ncbi:unnamed protein product [Rhodiola kirilowii]
MSDEKFSSKIPHFDGNQYDHWSELMENLLRAKGLWNLVQNGFIEPNESAIVVLTDAQRDLLDNARQKDQKVKHYLFRAIDREVFEQILDRRTSKIVWDSLKSKYGGNERTLLNSLRRDFEILQMKDGETITEYFARVMAVANKMRSNGAKMPDSKVVQKILRSLMEKFTYVVISIEESRDTSVMTVDDLHSSLAVHEQKFKRASTDDDVQALKVEGPSRGRGRGTIRGRSIRGRGRGRQQTFDKYNVDCFKCHKLGHFQHECPRTVGKRGQLCRIR